MDWLHALILGIVQGLTEYLPVSSSGHLEIGKALLGPEAEAGGLTFDIVVHVATVLSTLVILWKEVIWIFGGLFSPFKNGKMNNEQRYVVNILISMIPVGIVGVFFKDKIEAIFGSGTTVVGCCLLVTAALLTFSYYQAASEGEHLGLACLHHRNSTGRRSTSGHFPFRLDHRNRYHARQQEGASGTVLIPYGDPSHPG